MLTRYSFCGTWCGCTRYRILELQTWQTECDGYTHSKWDGAPCSSFVQYMHGIYDLVCFMNATCIVWVRDQYVLHLFHCWPRLRLALCTVLNCTPGAFVVLLGVVCSSWTVVNAGTSKRAICHPLGSQDRDYVKAANVMISRFFCCK